MSYGKSKFNNALLLYFGIISSLFSIGAAIVMILRFAEWILGSYIFKWDILLVMIVIIGVFGFTGYSFLRIHKEATSKD